MSDLFQAIQFSISTQFSSLWPIDRTLSGAHSLGQSGTGSDGSEGVLFTDPSARAGYDTRSIFFKRTLTGLNSEFSFS